MVAYIINIPMNFFYRVIRENYKNPKHEGLIKGVSLLLSWVCVLMVITLLLTTLIPQIVNSAITLTNKWPIFMRETYNLLKGNSLTDGFADSFMEFASSIDWMSFRNIIFGVFRADENVSMITLTTNILNSIGSSAILIFTIVVFSIFVLVYKDMLKYNGNKILYAFFKEETADYINKVFSLSYHTFKDYIFSRMIAVAMLTVFTYVGMRILRIPNAPMISVFVGVSDLIPIFGPIFGALISAILIFIESPVKALIFLIFNIIIQQLQENVFYPAIANAQVGLPAVWVLASVTVGGALFGIVGMLVSIPVASILYTLFHEKVNHKLMEKGFDEADIDAKYEHKFYTEVEDETI